MSHSAIAEIVDATALIAARVQGVSLPNGTVAGVRAIYGAGQNTLFDPFRPGQYIQPVPETPLETFEHWSELPDAPTIVPDTQGGTVRLEWDVPMRLILARGSLPMTRQIGLPFYDAYLSAFWADRRIGGLVQLSYIKSFARGGDGNWAWLEMHLHVAEYVAYPPSE